MIVVSLDILPVSVVVAVDVVAAAEVLDTVKALAMDVGVTVLVAGVHRRDEVCHHHARLTIAGHHHTVDERRFHTQTETGLRTGVVAGADKYGDYLLSVPEFVILADLFQL